MNEIDKVCVGLVSVCLIGLVVMGAIISHDDPLYNEVKTDIELSFYLQVNDSMTNLERYNLAMLICEQAYDERSDEMWRPPEKQQWIKNKAFNLVYVRC